MSYNDSISRKSARQNQILDAAAHCFVEKGFHGAGMAEVAKRSGMSTGHIYHYFDNKQAIILAIVEREGDEALVRISELEKIPVDTFKETFIEHIVAAITKKISPFQTSLDAEIVAEGHRNEEVRKRMLENDERVRAKLCEVLKPKLGVSNLEQLVDSLMTLLIGITSRYSRNPERVSVIIETLLRTTLASLIEEFSRAA